MSGLVSAASSGPVGFAAAAFLLTALLDPASARLLGRAGASRRLRHDECMDQPAAFLTAEWRHLAMLNYEADPAVLAPLVPRGTELDLWQGRTLVSVVGFLFLDTRVKGIAIPGHRDFEEVNLRFYVRRHEGSEMRRGVVFVKEIVPRAAIAAVARVLYNENYAALAMRHRLDGGAVEYEWRHQDRWNSLRAVARGEPVHPDAGSEEEFIAEHYWGYARQRDGGTVEYRVEHPPWRVQRVSEARLDCDATAVYGAAFAPFLAAEPVSAFVAEGSAIVVREGVRLC